MVKIEYINRYGYEKDDETGYNYYGARYYTDRLSIWLSVDPLADKYPSISPYAYCNNNPVRFVDPDGRNPFLASGAAGLALVEYGLIAAGIITTGRILYLCSDGTIRIKDSVKAKFGAMATIMIANLLSEAQRFANIINGETTQKPSNKNQSVSNNSSSTTATPDPDDLKRGNSKNEKHGDGGRAKSKVEKQIKDLEEQAKNASNKKEREKINRKITNIREDAARKAKGEEHSRSSKR